MHFVTNSNRLTHSGYYTYFYVPPHTTLKFFSTLHTACTVHSLVRVSTTVGRAIAALSSRHSSVCQVVGLQSKSGDEKLEFKCHLNSQQIVACKCLINRCKWQVLQCAAQAVNVSVLVAQHVKNWAEPSETSYPIHWCSLHSAANCTARKYVFITDTFTEHY
jgi:hypothetical protein